MHQYTTPTKNLLVTSMSLQEYAERKRRVNERALTRCKIPPMDWDLRCLFRDMSRAYKNQNPGQRARALDL